MAGLSPIISIYITDIIICHKQRDTPIISHPSIHPSPQYQTSPFYGRNMCTYPIKPWFLKAWVFLQTINIHRPYNRSVLVFTKYIRNWDHRINKDHININIYIYQSYPPNVEIFPTSTFGQVGQRHGSPWRNWRLATAARHRAGDGDLWELRQRVAGLLTGEIGEGFIAG